MSPSRLGTSGSVRARSTAKSARWAHVVHTFWPVTTQSSPSRSARVRKRREVGAGAGLAEQLAPHLLVAHDRREEPPALLLGAVREQRRRREVEPERVQPPEVERPQLGVDGPRHRGRHVEPAVLDRPRRGDEPRRPEHRVPGLVVGARAHGADRGRARRAAASRQATGTCSSIHACTRRDRGRRRRPASASDDRHRPSNSRRALLGERGKTLPEVLAARRQLERERLVGQVGWRSSDVPGVQQPLGQAERDGGGRRQRATSASASASRSLGIDGAVDQAPLRGLRPAELAAEDEQLARPGQARPAAAAARWRRCRA